MRILRGKQLVRGHKAHKCQRQDSKPRSLAPEAVRLPSGARCQHSTNAVSRSLLAVSVVHLCHYLLPNPDSMLFPFLSLCHSEGKIEQGLFCRWREDSSFGRSKEGHCRKSHRSGGKGSCCKGSGYNFRLICLQRPKPVNMSMTGSQNVNSLRFY